MTVREVEALFRPRSVALVTEGEGPLIRTLTRNLSGTGGLPLERPGAAADLCIIAAPPDRQPALVAQAAQGGARAVVLVGIHDPADPASAGLVARVREAAWAGGVRVVGPNSLGIAMPAAGRRLVGGAFHRPPQAGRVALVSQSGTLTGAMLDWAARRDVGFSHVAALGDMADVGFAEVLDYLGMQADCHAILLVMDRVTEARRFLSAARAAARLKPVIVLRTGQRGGHPGDTGGTPDRVYDAAFRRAGLLRADDLESLFDALETLTVAPALKSDRLAIVANGRGIAGLAADVTEAGGGRLASPAAGGNPLDLGEAADGPAFAAAVKRLRADREVDAVLLLHAPTVLSSAPDIARAVAEAAAGPGHPVLTSWLGDRDAERVIPDLARHHVPVFDTPDRAVRAFLQGVGWRRVQALLTETPPSRPSGPPPDRDTALSVVSAARWGGRTVLDDKAARVLFGCYGVTVTPPESDLPPGHDLMMAVGIDPLFGPVITISHAAPRINGDGVCALPPLNLKLAAEALERVPAVRLLIDEGLPDGIRESLALLPIILARMTVELDDVAGLTLGPVRVGPHGIRVAGVRVWLLPAGERRVPFAVLPYPTHLEHPLPLPDGRRLVVRPVRPEDEPSLKALFERLTPAEIRLRFFAPKQELSHSVAARMTQIDYDREMGLVVADQSASGGIIHGAVHLSGDSDGERAEFAIMVAHDMAGLGLGPVLMRRIIDHARSRGLREVFGEVLMENRSMLRLCEVMGFSRRHSPDDPGVVHVTLAV